MAITSVTAAIISAVAVVVSTATSVTAAAIQAQQQNAQIKYQQEVQRQNAIAAENKALAEAKARRTQVAKVQAAARAKMAASGVDSTSGSFLDLIGQGAAHGEMDVLKAKFDGDASAWAINTKIGELETQKQSVGLNATLAGVGAAADGWSKFGGTITKGFNDWSASRAANKTSSTIAPAMATPSETGVYTA